MRHVQESSTFSKWLESVGDRSARMRIVARINRLATGLYGDARPVGAGISELRIDHGPGYRVYFIGMGRDGFMILCGGTKNTQRADIQVAHALAAAFREHR